MSVEFERNPLWLILVEAVHSLPLYLSHKAYVRDSLMLQNPKISVEEISQRLDIPLGEAMVILREVRVEGGVDSKGSDDGARDS